MKSCIFTTYNLRKYLRIYGGILKLDELIIWDII